MRKIISICFLRSCFLLFPLLFFFNSAFPQEPPKHFFEAGISASSYRGDLNNTFQQWTAIYNVGIKFYKKKRLNGSFNIFAGSVMGQNGRYEFKPEQTPAPTPNTYFKTSLVGANYDLQVNIIKTKRVCFYVSQGIGLMRFIPKNQFNSKLQDQLTTRAKGEDYGNMSFIFPTKAGFMYFLPAWYAMGVQTGFFNPTSDYLDNISTWGVRKKKDNVFFVRLSIFIPLNVNHKESPTVPNLK